MATVAVPIVGLVCSCIANFRIPIWRQIRYFVKYHKNINKFRKEKQSLDAAIKAVRERIDNAEANGNQINPQVQNWIQRAAEKFEEMETLDKKIEEKKGCFQCGCFSFYKHSKKAKKITEESSKIRGEGSGFNTEDKLCTPLMVSVTAYRSDMMVFESTREAMREVLEALNNKEVFVVGVYGMGGSGKTTMVNLLREDTETKELFDHVVMATVSQDQNPRRIQGQIAHALGLALAETVTEEVRPALLCQQIMRKKKVLIILDDIWSPQLELTDFGIPSIENLKTRESKILLTSRKMNVCLEYSQASIQLKLLSEADSWILFKSTVGTDFSQPPEFEAVAKKVAKCCGCLPIALVVVARALRGESTKEWENAAQDLKGSNLEIVDDDDKVFKCILFSYNFLKNQTKRYLLICCLFAEDVNISKEDVLRYGKGLGLFEGTLEEARRDAHRHAKRLIDLHLLLEGDQVESIKMHDVIRYAAIRIASEPEHAYNYKVQKWPTDNFETCKAISLTWKQSIIPQDVEEYTNLEILLLQDNHDGDPISDQFFQGKEALKVLDLSRNLAVSILPESITRLTNLQTLSLNECKLTDVSALGQLKKLKILSLRKSGIQAMPEAFTQLKDLRLLDVTRCQHLHNIPPKVISALSRLEELYLQGSFLERGIPHTSFVEILELRNLSVLKIDVKYWEHVPKEVRYAPSWKKYDICISHDLNTRIRNAEATKIKESDERSLVLDATISELPKWFSDFVSNNAENLWYRNYNFNILFEQGTLRHMKSLRIENCDEMTHLVSGQDISESSTSSRPVLESLEELKLFYNELFKEICHGELPEGSLANLKFLGVQQCRSLAKSFLPSLLIKNLKKLERVELDGNPVEKVFNFNGLSPGHAYLTKLRELKLKNSYKLSDIWDGPVELAKLDNLRVVKVEDCRLLRYIFPPALFHGLPCLEELYLKECAKLEKIVLMNGSEANGEEIPFPRLKKLSLINLPMLTTIYDGSESVRWPLLKEPLVKDCPNFSNFRRPLQQPLDPEIQEVLPN